MQKLKKVAIGGISTECSTYSPLFQTEDDFEMIQGTRLVDLIGFPFTKFKVEAIPVFFQKFIPGGPVVHKFYLKCKSEFLKKIEEILPLDGILLIMHGTMNVPGNEDPEGDWI